MSTGRLRTARKFRPVSSSMRNARDYPFDEKVSQTIDYIVQAEIEVEKCATRSSKRNTTIEYRCESFDENCQSKDALLLHRTERQILRARGENPETNLSTCTCPYCGEKFAKSTLLLRHQRKRCRSSKIARKVSGNVAKEIKSKFDDEKEKLNTGPIECDICHKIFKKKKYIRVHMRLHGSPRVCEICGAILASEFCLDQHTRRHTSDYSIFCKICQKGFYQKATLNIHMAKHTNEKSVACEICQKAFANRVYLRSHMRTHLEPKMRKKFKCEICKFETFWSYCYKEHRQTHTGEGKLACKICGKFIRRQYMKTHTKMHNGEKSEICEFCGKGFVSRKYLTKHRRIHTGEDRSYICFVCDKNFTQRSSLTKHLKLHDNEESEDCTNVSSMLIKDSNELFFFNRKDNVD